jgi:two-component system OmpR family response regulator
MLGREDGTELIGYLKEVSYPTKVMILSRLNQLEVKLGGLRLGADEYLAKPCCSEEILVRLEHLMIMEKRTPSKFLSAGDLKLDPLTGKLLLGNRQLMLRRREAEILGCLLRHKNTVVTRRQLIENVWGTAEAPTETTVDVYIRRIRLIIKNNHLIKTIRGFGYMLSDRPKRSIFYDYSATA